MSGSTFHSKMKSRMARETPWTVNKCRSTKTNNTAIDASNCTEQSVRAKKTEKVEFRVFLQVVHSKRCIKLPRDGPGSTFLISIRSMATKMYAQREVNTCMAYRHEARWHAHRPCKGITFF